MVLCHEQKTVKQPVELLFGFGHKSWEDKEDKKVKFKFKKKDKKNKE